MPVDILVGTQWGDEGKGKLIDVLTRDVDMVVRFQGGNNAGHTVEIGSERYVLHLVPSGIFRKGVRCVIGNGLVVDPVALTEEMKGIAEKGFDVSAIELSNRAQLIFEYHKRADVLNETGAGSKKIGTTKRGIGPCYSDKASRVGLRAGDILDEDWLRKRLELLLPKKNRDLEYYGLRTFTVDELVAKCAAWRERFGSYIIDSQPVVREAVENGRNILLEGQLGIMRDNDWGIYPYSTSSNPTTAGACNGAGIPPRAIDKVVGVIKAYSTSVGGGPYMTELFDEDGEKLRTIGGEFGVTTGRPRRCGWLDLVAADYACYMNGVSDLALTKLDVLDSFEKIRVCTGYMIDGDY